MKHSKIYLLLLIPTAAFLLFAAGFCIGRNQPSDELRVVTARTPASQGTTAENETAPPGEISSSDTRINLNTATAEELMTLPGIGEVFAERIVAYREIHGRFTSLDELAEIEGLGEKRIDAIRDYLTLEDSNENTGR